MTIPSDVVVAVYFIDRNGTCSASKNGARMHMLPELLTLRVVSVFSIFCFWDVYSKSILVGGWSAL